MFSSEGDSDGAHGSSIPVVPCPNATTGQPPWGTGVLGMYTDPETTVSRPVSPLVERYRTRADSQSPLSGLRSSASILVALTRDPGSEPPVWAVAICDVSDDASLKRLTMSGPNTHATAIEAATRATPRPAATTMTRRRI